jgi:hypothetical protein
MSRFRMSRRQLLGAAATTAVAGLALARETPIFGEVGTLPGSFDDGDGALNTNTQTTPLAAWVDGSLLGDDLALAQRTLAQTTLARSALTGLQPKVLELDLLWQWRRELVQELQRGVRAVAMTRWDKAFVLKGLAREAALPVRQARIGHSLFQTEIG